MKTKLKMKNEKKEALGVKEFVFRRKKKGLYTLVFVAGLPGSGKSYSCIRLGEIATKMLTGKNTFHASNIFDDFVSLVKFVRDAKPEEVNVGVIEEASVLFPSRRAMARENVDINRVLDTARKKQIILFANAPLWPSIDSHMRSLGNFYLETLAINKKEKKVIAKPLILQTNPRSGKTYYHRPTVSGREVHRTWIGKPHDDVVKEYERQKDNFLDNVYSKAIHKKRKKEEKLKKEMGNANKDKFTEEELKIWHKRFNEKKTLQQIARELGYKSRSTINRKLDKIKHKLSPEERNKDD